MLVQVLVEDQINAGREIQGELRKEGFRISNAFWCRMPSGLWRLVIGSRIVDRIGGLEGYRRLNTVLDRLGLRISMSGSISLLSPEDPAYQRLLEYAKSSGQFGVSASPALPYNVFQDAYFYN